MRRMRMAASCRVCANRCTRIAHDCMLSVLSCLALSWHQIVLHRGLELRLCLYLHLLLVCYFDIVSKFYAFTVNVTLTLFCTIACIGPACYVLYFLKQIPLAVICAFGFVLLVLIQGAKISTIFDSE